MMKFLAEENLSCGDMLEVNSHTGRIRRYRQPVRKIRLVRKNGNMYLIQRHPLGTKFWFDVYDWGLQDGELSMHLFETERERDFARRRYSRKDILLSGRIAWRKDPLLPAMYSPPWRPSDKWPARPRS